MNEPARLVTTKPDAEIAAELKRDMLAALKPVLEILERARSSGFVCTFQTGAASDHAPIAIQQLQIMKQF